MRLRILNRMMYVLPECTGVSLCHLQHFLIFRVCDFLKTWSWQKIPAFKTISTDGGIFYHAEMACDTLETRRGAFFTMSVCDFLKTRGWQKIPYLYCDSLITRGWHFLPAFFSVARNLALAFLTM